jgi:hypothetical protein
MMPVPVLTLALMFKTGFLTTIHGKFWIRWAFVNTTGAEFGCLHPLWRGHIDLPPFGKFCPNAPIGWESDYTPCRWMHV